MIIAVDCDEVMMETIGEWLKRYNRDHDDNLTVRDFNEWNLSGKFKCGDQAFYEYLHDADLYDCIKPIDGALEGIEELRKMGHRIVFATSTNFYQAGKKLRWLERHGVLILKHGTLSDDYVEIHDKGLLRADLLIDDGPHNLEKFVGDKLLFDNSHNWKEDRFHRVMNWKETVEAVRVRAYASLL